MGKSKPKPSGDATVVKANSLIQAGYRLTLAEQHVMLAAISQVRRDEAPTDQETYAITANALSDLTGSTARRAYQELAESAHRLYERQVRIEGGPNGEEKSPKGKRVVMTRWVRSIEYVPDEGLVEIRFSHDVLPYLSLLKKEFTQYQFRHISQMRSTHGIRLYELLQQWRQMGEREIDLDDLRTMFGVDGKYPSIKDLKARVIEPAVRDVNECSDLTVTWGQRKRGRRVAAIQFQFEPKREKKAVEGKRKKTYTHRDLEKDPSLAKPGESYDAALARLNQEKMTL